MKNVNYLIGNENIISKPLKVYSDEVCEFLNEVSSEILKSPISRMYPDLSAVAFWCRKANIAKKKSQAGDMANRLGRGLCFHIAPSNIPVNFAFTYFFGLLSGNSNIVRIPSKDFPQINALIDIFKKVLPKYPSIEDRTAFVRYERNNEITEEFSKMADCRMIWGGDRTISTLRAMETKPRCIDIAFADRYSVCILDGDKILEADEQTITRLSENFYNDTYLMDQNACSSPQLIYWQNDSDEARNRFWESVLKTAQAKYVLQDAVAVDKYTKLCEDAINFGDIIKSVQNNGNILYRSELNYIDESVENLRGKGGYFYEYSLKNIGDFLDVINEKYQTITYFGLCAQDLAEKIINNNIKGIDRIVPVGKAMDIDILWDGHDLAKELSRKIGVE